MGGLAFLENLPSRGTLVSIQPGAVFSVPPAAYIADHDTAPPEHQVVKSDPTSLLIRTLQNKKSKEEAKRKAKAADKGKRPVDEGEGGRAAKRPAHDGAGPSGAGAGGSGSGAGPSGSGAVPAPSQTHFSKLGLQAKTIKELQTVLKAWNLPISGKKDDLISRILDHQSQHRG